MRLFCYCLLLLGLATNQVLTDSTSKPPFREGIEYRYEWEASMESDSGVNNQVATSTWLRGQLYVITKVEDTKWRSLLKIKNVSLAMKHGEKSSQTGNSFIELTELNEQLSKPFHLLYSGSKVEGAAFPDDKEPLWSTNFKRSIASILQVDLSGINNYIYSDKELSLYGKCEVNYYSSPMGENQHSVTKHRDLDSCPELPLGRWRTFIDMPSCPGGGQQTVAGLTSTATYVVAINRGYPELLKIESSGVVWLDPFGVDKSSMKSKTNVTLHLEKTRRSTESITPAKLAFKDHLKFVFQREEKTLDLKAAQNLMLHPESLIYGQENLRRRSQLDLINAVEFLSAESYTSEQRISMDVLPLSAISYQLGSLDYANAKALYKELAIAPKNEKLHSARNIFLDLILHSGSNVGVILIRDLILEGSLDVWSAARLVAYAGIYVKEPSEKLLLEFQQITEAKISGEGDQLNVFKNAAILAVASLVGRTCSAPRVCRTVKIDEWQKKYYGIIASSSNSFADRALYVHALQNVGYGHTLDSMLEMAIKRAPLDDESANDLRVYIIKGLAPYKTQAKVWNILVRLLRDVKDSFRVRIASAQVILDEHVTTEMLQLMQQLLSRENNSQVRHYVISAIKTIANNHNPCNTHVRARAKQILNAFADEKMAASSSSAEYAFDFLDSRSSFGSQLNLKTTNSEFDDLTGFVAGKVLYFVKGVTVQPFSFTVRMSGMRKYITSVFSSTLQKEDLVMSRIAATMDDFNFAPRKELGVSSLDIAFKLHGATIMFYNFDKNFLASALASATNLEFLHDLSFNIQRYATTGALLYTQPNGLGIPVSFIFSAPILISLKGSIAKTKQAGTVGRNINLNLYGEIYGDHGILTHFTPLNVTQGVVRNRKAIFNVPLSFEVIVDPKKMQTDVTIVNPKATNAIEISSFGRTILTLRPSESSYEKVKRACPQCLPVFVISRKDTVLKTETIANLSSTLMGTEAHAQVFNCDGGRSVGKQIQTVLEALNPLSMNFRGSLAGWAYLSFLQLQHHMFIQPEARHCGFRGRIFRSSHLPVKEMSFRFKMKSNVSDDAEVSWQSGKMSVKIEVNWKGETATTDRKGELDMTYEYRNAGSRNNVNVRAFVARSPQLNIPKDFLICLKAESTFQPTPVDVIDISSYTQPPVAQGSIEYVMGDVSSSTQCPTDQFRFKMGIKASAGSWVMQRRSAANIWPYKECEREKKNQNWAPGIVPQTEACYRAALDFTTLSNYNFEFRFAAVPFQLEKMMGKVGDLISLSLLPYWKAEPNANSEQVGQSKEVGRMQVNVTFLPDKVEEGHQMVNLHWATNNVIERYDHINIPVGQFLLPSTSISQTARIAYEGDVIPSCLVTSQYIRTLDKFKFNNTFSPCYTLVTSDCGSNPLFGVFVRRTTGLYPLATKVQVGGHTIEIMPDESGRRKQFTVRANDLEIDVSNNSYTLPEGRDNFYVLKVRYQAPIYIISSPGAGLLVHYSGSHVAVFPTWFHKNQHCGLCGNFDGETDREWISPQGCPVNNATVLIASYTLGQTCYPNQEKLTCPDSNLQ
ncbi:uncharacterized protein LOC124209680 [Daphnia pulex]|uniref:uncharacterized protein LOC124209680 n=1 Tax=Daphnia pulex TaxID=6669 RepID=UPI001EDDDD20|nr:uncharacterized protein LOC124209680 [Daphnia pulex]